MAAKSLLVLCALAGFVKISTAQCIGAMTAIPAAALIAEEPSCNPLAYGPGFGAPAPAYYGAPALNIAPTSGGGFPITCSSPLAPTGIAVISENAIEGPVIISGQLPFLGAIAMEGALPTAGAGAINYGCGNGAVGILSEGVVPALAPAPFPAGLGYNAAGLGFNPAGLGYNAAGFGYPGLAGRGFNGLGLGAGCGAVY